MHHPLPEIPSSTLCSGSPKRSIGGVFRRPHYPKYPSNPFVCLYPSPPGLLLRGRVTESFNLFSGEVVQPSDYVQDLLLYRAPCLSGAGAGRIAPLLADGLRTSFPVTPSHQYTIAELLQGEVGIAIVPPEMEQSGVLAGPDGALLLSSDGIALTLPAGALERTVPVQLQSLADAAVAPLIPTGFTLLQAVRIDLSRQTLQTGALLSLPLPAGFDPLRPVVLAQVFAAGGGERLRGVAFLKPVGSLLTSVTSVAGVSLPGIRSGGTYCILQSESLLGLVRGTVRTDNSQPFAGALLTANSGSLADLSAASGSYLLFAPLGQVHVTALDLTRFDRGEASGTLAYAESALSLDPVIRPTVPSVVALAPDNGATGVDPTARISITFSEPVERSNITSASIVLSSSTGTPVAGVFSFSPAATTVSFYPEARLVSEGVYHLDIASSVRDLQGYGLAAPVSASFTVRDTTPPPLPPAGSITATFPDSEGMITVTATQGSAEYDATVLIINDTSGEIVSIAPFSNGSFNARIHGQLGDEIQIVMMDNAGNQTLISYLTFSATDGRTLVTAKGGKVEGEGGLTLELPAGALVGPAVVKIVAVQESELAHPVPAEARFIGAVSIDSGGLSFAKEVELSIPLPADLPAGAFPFLAQPLVHTNPDGSTEEVYQLIDTVKIVNGRLTTASPPFLGVMTPGIFAFLYLPSPEIGPVVVSGITYRDLNGQPGYQPNPDGGRETPPPGPNGELLYNYDQPIRGAVIRSPGGYNFLAYSDQSGHYAAFGFSVADACRPFEVTAIHPQTMFRHTANLTACDAPYIVNNLNFQLADKLTTIPDKTSPVIEFALQPTSGQGRITNGTTPVGTQLQATLRTIDQSMGSITLTLEYQSPDSISPQTFAIPVSQGTSVLYRPLTGDEPALNRYPYTLNFTTPFAGSNAGLFHLSQPGFYTLKVEATDADGNSSKNTINLRAVAPGSIPAGYDGPPFVISITPGGDDVDVDTSIKAIFSEVVDNVNETTFQLFDKTLNVSVPAVVTAGVEEGIMQATLIPKGALNFNRTYEIVISPMIIDSTPNPSADGGMLPLVQEYRTAFTTQILHAYALADAPFAGGQDIDLYAGADANKIYAYVTAGDAGWRIVDVSDSTKPKIVYPAADYKFPGGFNYRGVAVEGENGLLAITENIVYLSGGQYGYVRFYDLGADPIAPPRIGQEKIAEAYSGIPGRVALSGNYAYIATVGAGLQVVDIDAAVQRFGKISDGSTIVGNFDSVAQRLGQPHDIIVYKKNRAVLVTSYGYLVNLDLTQPQLPTETARLGPAPNAANIAFGRLGVAADYLCEDGDGAARSIDLGVAGTRGGEVRTIDLTDPANPQLLGTVTDGLGNASLLVSVRDVAIDPSAGLAIITTFNSIAVVDVKDPEHPRLLNTFTQLPDANGDPLYLGTTSALAQLNGWLYMANQTSGLRVMQFGGKLGVTIKCTDCYNNK